MSNLAKPKAELSPLDQIRQAEADVARQIASAREATGQTVAQARIQAKDMLGDARQIGKREGEKRYREIVSNAEEEEQAIIAQACNRAEHLSRRAGQRLAEGVRRALNVVIGLEDVGEDG
jgi:vacuolar-type H+-ATPase subunit H